MGNKGEPKIDLNTPARRLRSGTSYFLGLKEEDSLPLGGLPTNKNVLEVILLHKDRNKRTSVDKLVVHSAKHLRLLVTSVEVARGKMILLLGALSVRSWKSTPKLVFLSKQLPG